MSATEFFAIIAAYNSVYLIATILTIILGIVAVIFAIRKTAYSDQLISLTLAFLWLWVGIVFGFITFGAWTPIILGVPIPGFGYFFGLTFTIQGLLFLYFGVYRKSLSFQFQQNLHGFLGLILIIYAIVIYGLIGFVTGHPFPFYPLFGTSPCPVSIFTIGLFLWADERISPVVLIIPLVHGLIAIVPIIGFGIYADILLFLSGLITIFILYRHWKWEQTTE
ncbi:MAG: DUF6064 family protein [Promethearchaeota archaeon]